jgi:uroporphyrinogen-III decarboxylase
VDFQNVYEAVAHGCSIVYCHHQVPDTRPLEAKHSKRELLDQQIPDPFDNPAGAKIWSFHNHFVRRQTDGFEWKGRPIAVANPSGLFTDGPVTGACNLMGAMEFCLDLVEDPSFAEDLLSYLTDTIIARITAYRESLGMPPKTEGFLYADDSIALLSKEMVREKVLPHHRRLLESLSSGGPNSIHLCGDATRHFPMLKEELNIRSFDTGFPVDFGGLRSVLGDEIEIFGGPSVPFLTNASPEEAFDETVRVLNSGIKSGGRFILREGNNLAPEVSPANVAAMYEAVQTHGHFSEQR